VFLWAATRDLGARRAVLFLVWGFCVALAAEYASTRVGIPFGIYHYTGLTRGVELYISNVPFFDSLSFPFLAYAAFCLARRALGTQHGAGVVVLAGVLMMALDVIVDPLAVRGDRWFLGRIFYYPAGGVYFGVPLSNFAGWMLVGWAIVGGYAFATRLAGQPSEHGPGGSTSGGVLLYYGVLLFNLVLTAWIREWRLLAAGILVHLGAGLLLYWRCAQLRRARLQAVGSVRRPADRPGHDFDSTRSCRS
jgi:putative membrane protein